METPLMLIKKPVFYASLAALLLVGIVLGVLLASYTFSKNTQAFCAAAAAPKAGAAISQEAIDKVSSLQPGSILRGKVVSASASKIVMEVTLTSPLDAKVSQTAEVAVPVGPNDKILRLKRASGSTVLKSVVSSIKDVKAGDVITVKVASDGTKIIYLPTI